MILTHRKVGEVTVAAVHAGYLDRGNCRPLEQLLTGLTEGGPNLVLDLGRVEWMDSSACGALIALLKRLKERGGDLKLCALTRPVRTLLELIRLHKILDIFNSPEEAVRAFRI